MNELDQMAQRMSMLYDHQKKIVLEDKKKFGLFLSTGSGKTRTALMLARGATLIICPKTQWEDKNWEREAEKLNLDITTIYVISKEQFRKQAATLPPVKTIIVDEAHTMLGVTPNTRSRNKMVIPKASQLFDALEDYVTRVKPERIYLVTATIVKNPMTVWAAAKILGRSFDFWNWRHEFYIKLPMPGREVYVPKDDSNTKDKLAKVVQAIGHVGKLSDYFDVPDQTYRTVWLELNEKQKKRMKELALEYPEPIVLLGKKHQVENGVLAGDEFKAPELFENQKIDKLLELGEEFPRMVIFVKYTAQIKAIVDAFQDTDKKVFVLNGSTKDRGGLLKAANECHYGVFIAQAQVSAGWELPDWPVMVFASMSYSVVDRIQGEGRILRANALKKNLYIDLVVKGGIDEAVFDSIKNKQDFNERIYLNL